MDELEILHITKNLEKLIHFTTCNAVFLTILKQNFILDQEDIQKLKLVHLTEYEQARQLYSILEGRHNAYQMLLLALKETKQSGAVVILERLFQLHPFKKPRIQKYITVPTGLDDFLLEKPTKSWAIWKKASPTVFVISTPDVSITTDKIQDASKNKDQLENFESPEEVIRKLKSVCKSAPTVLAVQTNKIINFLNQVGSTSKRILIVTEEPLRHVQEAVESCSEWKNKIKIVEDTIKWADLSPKFQNEIQDRVTLFQNTPIQLNNLHRLLESNDEGSDKQKPNPLENNLDGAYLSALINDERPPFYNNTVPPKIQYYVSRCILSLTRISKALFKKELPDIFLFTGIERHELTNFIEPSQSARSGRRTDTSRNQLKYKELTARFIILQLISDLEEISNKTKAPIHWLRYENGNFTWIKSVGSMSGIQGLVDTAQCELSEEEFASYLHFKAPIDRSTLPICIADTPGMGKTVLLASIGRQLQSMHPGTLVVFVFLSEFVMQIKSIRDKDEQRSMEQAIIHVLAGNICTYKQLESVFENGVIASAIKIELLLDGYDEVNANDLELTNNILRCIRTSFKSIRLIVSTRPHLMIQLENTLETIGFNIQAFSEEDQIQFLMKFWLLEKPLQKLDQERLKSFGMDCLATVKSKVSEKEKDIAGIPLLCLLIGEVYERTAVSFSDLTNVGDENAAADEVDITCITDLFEQAVAKKIERYIVRYAIEDLDQDKMMNAHIRESLRLLFPDGQFSPSLLEIQNSIQFSIENLLKIGILEKSSTEQVPRFIHRSFAEYFVATFVIKLLLKEASRIEQSENKICYEAAKFFLSSVLHTTRVVLPYIGDFALDGLNLFASTFSHQLTVYFLNAQLNSVPLSSFDYGCFQFEMGSSDKSDLALACAHDDKVNILKHLLDSQIFASEEHVFQSRNFLVVSVIKGSISLIELLKDASANFERHLQGEGEIIFKDPIFMLQAAASRGDYTVFEYLCYDQQFQEIVRNSHSEKFHRLLHASVQNTLTDKDGHINQRIQIIRLLLKTNRELINQVDTSGQTPILCFFIHPRLLAEMVDRGANLLHQAFDGNTVLHRTPRYLTNKQYHEFVTRIPREKFKQLLNIQDEDGRKPLHSLLMSLDPLDETLALFSRSGCNFQDALVLPQAFVAGRSTRCIESLIRYKADWQSFELGMRTTALHFAAEMATLQLVQLLISLGMDVNSKDVNGNSPLHQALKNSNGCGNEIVKLLLERGASPTALNKYNKSILHVAVREGLENVQFLIEQGLDVNSQDINGETPLHKAMRFCTNQTRMDVVSLLIESGAVINAKNKRNETPLMKMVGSGTYHLPTISLLISHGALDSQEVASLTLKAVVTETSELENFDEYFELLKECLKRGGSLVQKDKRGQGLLHHAATNLCLRGIKFLVAQEGTKINATDENGNTPLHLVVKKGDKSNRFQVAKYLVDNGADVKPLNAQGETPLSSLANPSYEHCYFDANLVELLQCAPETARQILTRTLSNGETRDIDEFDKELALSLIKCGADIDWKDEQLGGATWLHIACEKGTIDAIMFLVDQGMYVNSMDNSGNTPCHTALKNKLGNEVHHIRYLVQRGADLKITNNFGESLLHWAALYAKPSAIEYLVFMGCDVNLVGGLSKGTPLHYCFSAIWCEVQYSVAKMLIENKANVNAVNSNENSVAELSIQAFQKANIRKMRMSTDLKVVEIMKLLIDSDLDLNRRDCSGNTILHEVPPLVTASQLHEIIKYVVLKRKSEALIQRDGSNETVLQKALKHIQVLDETIATVKSCGLELDI